MIRMSSLKRHEKIAIFAGLILILLFIAFSIRAWTTKPEPWSFAFKNPVPVVRVPIKIYDHKLEWQAWEPPLGPQIVGAKKHWLGLNSVDVPKEQPARLWYDGKMIAEGWSINDPNLSPNGKHLGYVFSNSRNLDVERYKLSVIVDGHVVASGYNMTLHHIDNDGAAYYSCYQCSSDADESGFYKNGTKLINYRDAEVESRYPLQEFERSECLFEKGVDLKRLYSIAKSDIAGVTCSPDGDYIVTDKLKDLFPVGNADQLFLNDKKIADGSLIDYVVNNEGKLSYLSSNGTGGGSLTIRGKEGYTFEGRTSSEDILYSLSRDHMAVLLNVNGQEEWWVDGRPTGARTTDVVSLDDDAFYVYTENE